MYIPDGVVVCEGRDGLVKSFLNGVKVGRLILPDATPVEREKITIKINSQVVSLERKKEKNSHQHHSYPYCAVSEHDFPLLGQVWNQTFSCLVPTRETASPMASALPTRPVLWM
jgi:hypothetical protein